MIFSDYATILGIMELPPNLTDLTPVRENQRFATYRATYETQPVFVKQVKHPDLAARIRQELWGLQTFTELAEAYDLPFNLPDVLLNGNDFIVTTWVEGEYANFDPHTPNRMEVIEFFARSLAAIDKITRLKHPMTPKFDTPGAHGQPLTKRLQSRLQDISYQQHFEQALIDSSFAYLEEHLTDLESGFTHGDFTPHNILDNHGRRTLIDFESCSLRWPRFYDLVNLTFNRIITEPAIASECVRLAQRYFEINEDADVREHRAQVNTIAMVRSLSMINELMTDPDSYHNTTQSMTPDLAERLRVSMEFILSDEVYFESPVGLSH